MGIKLGYSKVYANAKDRNTVNIYKKNKRMKLNLNLRTTHFCTGNAKLKKADNYSFFVYYKQKTLFRKGKTPRVITRLQVPEKVYQTLRLILLKKITKTCKNIQKAQFCIDFIKFPHQILRYHAIASGARADRISQGMSNAYGRPLTKASVFRRDNELFLRIDVNKKYASYIGTLKQEFRKCMCKVPFKSALKVEKLKLLDQKKAKQGAY